MLCSLLLSAVRVLPCDDAAALQECGMRIEAGLRQLAAAHGQALSALLESASVPAQPQLLSGD